MVRKRGLKKTFMEWTLVSMIIAVVSTAFLFFFSYTGLGLMVVPIYTFSIAMWIFFIFCLFILFLILLFNYLKGR